MLTAGESQSASQKIPDFYLLTFSSLLLNVHVSLQVVQQDQLLPLEKKLLLHFAKETGSVLMCTVPRAHIVTA